MFDVLTKRFGARRRHFVTQISRIFVSQRDYFRYPSMCYPFFSLPVLFVTHSFFSLPILFVTPRVDSASPRSNEMASASDEDSYQHDEERSH